MARGIAIPYFDLSGGRNTQNAPYLLSENECREQLNVHTSLSGDIEKRYGNVTFSGETLTGEPAKATLVHSLYPANTASKSLLLGVRTATTDSLVKMTTSGTASVLKTGLTANKRWDWAQAEVSGGSGPLFGMNGTDTPQRWDGSAGSTSNWTALTGTVPAKGRYLTFWMSRLWCLEGSRLWYSGLTGSSPDPLNWDANNYVDLEANDGQDGTGLAVVGPYLVASKARKLYKITDPVTGSYVKISNEIGCIAHRSMVATQIGLLFLSEDQGICRTDGSKVEPISDQVRPDLVEAASHPETQEQAAGMIEGNRYQLSISLEGIRNDHTLEYDLTARSYWLHRGGSNQYALLDPGGTAVRYSADSTTTARISKVFFENVFVDNGSVYSGGAYWVSPWRAWGEGGRGLDPHIVKRIAEIRIDGVGNWDAFIATDFEEEFEAIEGEVWQQGFAEEEEFVETNFGGEGTFGGAGLFGGEAIPPPANAPVERRYYTPAIGRAFSLKLVDNSDKNFRINSITFRIIPRTD